MNYCPECGAKLAEKNKCECGFIVPDDCEPTGSLPVFPPLTQEYYRNAAINLGFIKPGDSFFMTPDEAGKQED